MNRVKKKVFSVIKSIIKWLNECEFISGAQTWMSRQQHSSTTPTLLALIQDSFSLIPQDGLIVYPQAQSEIRESAINTIFLLFLQGSSNDEGHSHF